MTFVNIRAYSSNGSAGATLSFSEIGLSRETLRAVTEIFKFQSMTTSQASSLPQLVGGTTDAVLSYRTGTGKTLAYLIPAIERLTRRTPPGVGVLIVAPSRELVGQIVRVADQLCSYHAVKPVALAGGVRPEREESLLRSRGCALVVATPARLTDHMEKSSLFRMLVATTDTLVLDECDKMMEEDPQNMSELLSHLQPNSTRQTLLVSATVSPEIHNLVARVCRPGYEILDGTRGDPVTSKNIAQFCVISPPFLFLTSLQNLISEEVAANPQTHKIIIFFPSARLVAFVARIFREQLKVAVSEIHGRCNNAERALAEQSFRQGSSKILFTSSASERGMDYPSVTLVVQALSPPSRKAWVHRVGRMARGLQATGDAFVGEAVLLITTAEQDFLEEATELGVVRHPKEAQLFHDAGDKFMNLVSSTRWQYGSQLPLLASAAFASLLKFLILQAKPGIDPVLGAQASCEMFLGCGLAAPPAISSKLARELGLRGGIDVPLRDHGSTFVAYATENVRGDAFASVSNQIRDC